MQTLRTLAAQAYTLLIVLVGISAFAWLGFAVDAMFPSLGFVGIVAGLILGPVAMVSEPVSKVASWIEGE